MVFDDEDRIIGTLSIAIDNFKSFNFIIPLSSQLFRHNEALAFSGSNLFLIKLIVFFAILNACSLGTLVV